MFAPLQLEIQRRFSSVESFFSATRSFKGDLAATAKGLVFVQAYAIYEFAVRSTVQHAIDSINNHKHKMKDIAPCLLALYLDPELTSLRDSGRKNIWANRLKLLGRAFSNDAIALPNNTKPPDDGTHYRHSHLIMIFNVFGIARLPVRRRRHLHRIDEVVNNRNQIAHGGETAEEVGRRYTRADMIHVLRQMKSVCLLLVSIFRNFCADSAQHKRS